MGSAGKKTAGGAGGTGITINVGETKKKSDYEQFIEDLVKDITKDISAEEGQMNPEELISNGDVQSIVEAYAIEHKGTDEDKMLNDIRDAVEKALKKKYNLPDDVAKQVKIKKPKKATKGTVQIPRKQMINILKNHSVPMYEEDGHIYAGETYTDKNGKTDIKYTDVTYFSEKKLKNWLGY